MTARDRVTRWASRLTAVRWARIALLALGVGTLAWVSLGLAGVSPATSLVFVFVAGLASGAAAHARQGRGRMTRERAALWIEEQVPQLRYSLVTAIEQEPPHDQLERAVRSVPWEESVQSRVWRSLRLPIAVAVVGVLALLTAPRARAALGASARGTGPNAANASRVALGDLEVVVTPPAYANLQESRTHAPSLVRALPGSAITVSGNDGRAPLPRVMRDSISLDVAPDGARWRAGWRASTERVLVRATRGGDTRLFALEPVVDSAPVVTLRIPARDTVLRAPQGTFALAADVHDDLGVAQAAFEYIVSSGEGERFTFRSGSLGARAGSGAHDVPLRATLSLEALQLNPGDVVHLRAVARDANTVTGPGIAGSDSRTIRIARQGEYDSVAVDPAPPPEADKSVLSQRMLINLTEALVRKSRTMAKAEVSAESQRIGRDQARLRRQVSDIIFSRLGDGPAGDHGHGEEGSDETEGRLTPEALLKAAEAATAISGEALDFDHDETPVVAINRPLLEAYNAMWDAGRELSSGAPQRALPPMRAALAAIQRARAAERLYLRGAPPGVVVDIAKVRMRGTEHGMTNRRMPREPLNAARRFALARFARAIELLAPTSASLGGTHAAEARTAARATIGDRAANVGIDSLLVLRLDVATDDAIAAAALERAIEALRSGRDATSLLIAARRALDHDFVASDSLGSWGNLR